MKTINRSELWSSIQAKEKLTLVEAQPKADFDKAHLPGALRVSRDELDLWAPKFLTDRDARIVVYCDNIESKASPTVAGRLIELGYTNVSNYKEGKADWMKAGHPVEPLQVVATA
ncbi:MAG: rhodanese-like domain-containing protein [Armatimonadetes bacterium]|nr:rhodanese-like domain-containing protein [Armatimonadota bacterium]